jgi:hypothetical protein
MASIAACADSPATKRFAKKKKRCPSGELGGDCSIAIARCAFASAALSAFGAARIGLITPI